MSTNPQASQLAVAMFEAFARNSGNSPSDHFDRNAAEQWMQQALDECLPKPAAAQEAAAEVLSCRVGNDTSTIDKALPIGTKLYAAPVTAAPADLIERCREILAWQRTGVLPGDALRAYANARWPDEHDPLQIAEKETAREAFRILARAAAAITPAAPGIDLSEVPRYTLAHGDFTSEMLEHSQGAWVRLGDVESALIDASPKGAAPRFELTNGQIAQLFNFGGTPPSGTLLEDQDVLVIQNADTGHSGPGLYAHYEDMPEEGAIYLDGQLPDSPKGGSDALSRAYGYLWHVNHPEDIPAGHPFMSSDRAAVEARKELRDMLTHQQRGEGINWVRQKLLVDMHATSPEATLNEQFGSAEGLSAPEDDGLAVRRVADHMAQVIDYIDKRYPDAAMLDRGPILRNIRQWEKRLRAVLVGSPKGGSEALDALRVAYRHLDVESLRVSHCNDLAIIHAAMQAGDAEVRP
ncbi:hypothetical protein [Stenotrophomonas acidaminiphila]|jgi:hypothetical protein